MASEPGVLTVVVEHARDLKDHDFWSKQDPYFIANCGGQVFRSRTAKDGGKNPNWNETFRFNIGVETSLSLRLMDEDTFSKDDLIGDCLVPLWRARQHGFESLQVPVICAKKGKQRGYVSLRLTFTPRSGTPSVSAAYVPPPASTHTTAHMKHTQAAQQAQSQPPTSGPSSSSSASSSSAAGHTCSAYPQTPPYTPAAPAGYAGYAPYPPPRDTAAMYTSGPPPGYPVQHGVRSM